MPPRSRSHIQVGQDLKTAEETIVSLKRNHKASSDHVVKLKLELEGSKKAYKRQGRDVHSLLDARSKARLEAAAGSKATAIAASVVAVCYKMFESGDAWLLPEEIMRDEIVLGAVTTMVAYVVGKFYVVAHKGA